MTNSAAGRSSPMCRRGSQGRARCSCRRRTRGSPTAATEHTQHVASSSKAFAEVWIHKCDASKNWGSTFSSVLLRHISGIDTRPSFYRQLYSTTAVSSKVQGNDVDEHRSSSTQEPDKDLVYVLVCLSPRQGKVAAPPSCAGSAWIFRHRLQISRVHLLVFPFYVLGKGTLSILRIAPYTRRRCRNRHHTGRTVHPSRNTRHPRCYHHTLQTRRTYLSVQRVERRCVDECLCGR